MAQLRLGSKLIDYKLLHPFHQKLRVMNLAKQKSIVIDTTIIVLYFYPTSAICWGVYIIIDSACTP